MMDSAGLDSKGFAGLTILSLKQGTGAASSGRRKRNTGGVNADTQSEFTGDANTTDVDGAVDGNGGASGVGSAGPAVCEYTD